MHTPRTIAVLKGGRTGEHEVSLESAKGIEAALAELGYDVWPIVLGRYGGATWDEQEGGGTVGEALCALERRGGLLGAFVAMHGSDGEDGRIQAALDLIGVPYQGSTVAASAVAMDKARSKAVYRGVGLPVAADIVFHPGAMTDWPAVAEEIGLPCVLKTAESGSSVGIEIVDTLAQLEARGDAMLGSGTANVLVESFVAGREFTVAVLESADGTPQALPVIEICPVSARFFDYEAKYTPGATDEICPARISEALSEELQRLALEAHNALGCRHYSRTDFMHAGADAVPVLLETNTLPGMTSVSLFPKAAAAAGLDFTALVGRLVDRMTS